MATEADLFRLLDRTETEMAPLWDVAWDAWNARMARWCGSAAQEANRAAQETSEGGAAPFDMRTHASIFGGFHVAEDEYAQMDVRLRAFFDDRLTREGGRVWLRGRDYYACDPQIYPDADRPDEAGLWRLSRTRWAAFRAWLEWATEDGRADARGTGERNPIDLLGCMSVAEWLLNDLDTLEWFVYLNSEAIGAQGIDTEEALGNIEQAVFAAASWYARCLLADPAAEPQAIVRGFADIVARPALTRIISLELPAYAEGCVRSIREGDTAPLIFAAYLLKLRAASMRSCCCAPSDESAADASVASGPVALADGGATATNAASGLAASSGEDATSSGSDGEPRVLFLSNGFGGLNLGAMFKALLAADGFDVSGIDTGNVRFSQHRAAAKFFSAGSGGVRYLTRRAQGRAARAGHVVVVDDCVFTGTSFERIVETLNGTNATLLPLALDVNSMRLFRRDRRDVDATYRDAVRAIAWARDLGGALPPFAAFWSWTPEERVPAPGMHSAEAEVQRGGDLLLKELWRRYRREILG